MFKPQLKRSIPKNITLSTSDTTKLTSQRQFQQIQNQKRQCSLVPEAFFQQTKSLFLKKNLNGLVASINTCQYSYPLEVQQLINSEQVGNVEYYEEIFVFYKLNQLFLWQYGQQNLNLPIKFLKHEFQKPVTAICKKQVIHVDFNSANIKLLIVAFGNFAHFYRICNFQKQNKNCTPYLQNLMISLYSPDIITNINIIYEQSQDQNPERNVLIIILGDANGNLVFFDFKTKRKYVVDSFLKKIRRRIQKQSYSQITKILPYKQFVFCLVRRFYDYNSMWKMLQRFTRNPRGNLQVQQKLEVYKIQLNVAFTIYYKGPVFINNKVQRVKKHCQYTNDSLNQKLRESFTKYYQNYTINQQSRQLEQIQSLSLKNGLVQIMFKSGQSVLVDQDISFAEPPKFYINKPAYFGLMTKNNMDSDDQFQTLPLVKSIGSNMMIFQDFIASCNQQVLFYTPYSFRQSRSNIRSIHQCYQKTKQLETTMKKKFLIFTQKTFILVQNMNLPYVLFLYCLAINQQFPHQKYITQQKRFNEKIQYLIESFGQVQILVTLIQLLMNNKLNNDFIVNLRLDLFQLAARQLSSYSSTKQRDIQNIYQKNDRNLIKNMNFRITKKIEQQIWKIILKIQKNRLQFTINNQWGITNVESICIALQVVISQIYKKIKNWDLINFCFHRNQTYNIISHSKALIEVIQSYLIKQSELDNRRGEEIKNTIKRFGSGYLSSGPKEYYNLKTKFCRLSKLTLQKLIILLKVYDYVCEMNLHGAFIPKLSDLLFNMKQSDRIYFAMTIIYTLGMNNQVLIDNLKSMVPQIPIEQIKKFQLWKSLRKNPSLRIQQLNKTQDASFQDQVIQISQVINQVFFQQIERFYINQIGSGNSNYSLTSQFDREKINKNQISNGVSILIRACLKKILDIRQEQIQLANTIQSYRRISQNYFGILQIPSLTRKLNQKLQQITFYTKRCDDLLGNLFAKYEKKLISKEVIYWVIESLRGQLSLEVKRILQKYLHQHNLTDLLNFSRRQLFSNQKSSYQIFDRNNFISHQLANDVSKKYI